MAKLLAILYFAFCVPGILKAQVDRSSKTDLPQTGKIQKYRDIINPESVTKKGLITVHKTGEKYYFEIPDNIIDKDLLVVTRVEKGPSALPVYGGDFMNNEVVRFERLTGNKILLKKLLFTVSTGDSTSAMYNSVVRSNLMPIIASFPILARSDSNNSTVIDITGYVMGDNELFSFSGIQKKQSNLTSIEPDKSYIESINSFPENVEISAMKTYSYLRNTDYGSVGSFTSVQINTSIVRLPEVPMRQRLEDIRIGYFSLSETDFEQNPEGVKERSYIKRWRLEPKPEDVDKYARGELVEPRKQIIFYIDPATPGKWIPYLIQGVNDWNVAFEQAGFKNAIVGKRAPTKEEDSTWNLYDARHSAIIYKPSSTKNASGPSISDPRTGEILESHINWYHNIMQLLHDQFMVSCGVIDPNARKMLFDDSLMGKLIRYAIAHEVGHTLGLQHNMSASSTVPVDSLRSNSWLLANGLCPSIMDYARFNYVAQPEDKINENNCIARIGVYDKWAIEWGYKWLPEFKNAEDEKLFMVGWTSSRLKDRRLRFGYENAHDPRAQTEDLGDDPIKASTYGIRNLKLILAGLLKWTATGDESYYNLNAAYNTVQEQQIKYLKHVINVIGGTYETIKLSTEDEPVYLPVPGIYQDKAMAFLNEYAFMQPDWIADTAILARTGQTFLGVMGLRNDEVIKELVGSPLRIYCIESRNESTFGKKAYTITSFLDRIKKDIWNELFTHEPIGLYRRNLQERYLKYVINYLKDNNRALRVFLSLPISPFTELSPTDAIEMMRGQVLEIAELAKADRLKVTDEATKYHLTYIINQIELLNK